MRLRYHEEASFELMAQRLGRSLGALYTAFSRIHAALARLLAESGQRPMTAERPAQPPDPRLLQAVLRYLDGQGSPDEVSGLRRTAARAIPSAGARWRAC